MPITEVSTTIDRPQQDVWDFMTTPDNAPLWQGSLIDFETSGPVEKGQTSKGVTKVAGKKITWTSETTELDAPNRWEVRSIESQVSFHLTYTLEDLDGSTKVTIRNEAGELGGFFGKLGDKLVTRMYEKDVTSDLAKLKELLEAGASA